MSRRFFRERFKQAQGGAGGGGVTDHGALTGLLDDDHTQYLLLAGRAGGQTAYGGTAAGDILELQGADNTPDVGRLSINSPVEYFYDTDSNTTPAEAYLIRWRPVVSTSGPSYVGGYLRADYDITVNTGVYIPGIFVDGGTSRIAATPVFSAYTFINQLHIFRNSGNFNLASGLIVNVGMVHERGTSGTSTSVGTTGFNFAPQTRALVSGAVMTKTTGDTGINCAPTFGTSNAAATVNLGITTGVRMNQPAVAIGQMQLGTETWGGCYGVHMTAMTFATSGDKAAVYNEMTDAVDRFVIRNIGGARSNFGGGSLFNCGFVQILSDSASLSLGAAGGDVQILWNGTGELHDPLVGDNIRYDYATNSTTWAGLGTSHELALDFERGLYIGAAATLGNQFCNFAAPARATQVNGEWADILLTQAGNLTIDHTMGVVSAWTINSIGLTSGAGTLNGPMVTLNVGGMTTSGLGGAETHALRVTGRSTHRGTMQYEPINPANITANQTAWAGLLTGSQNNGARRWARITANAALAIQGIDSTAVQDGDTYDLTNVGSNSIDLNDEDGAAAAADRIATHTSANVALGVEETITIRYDATSSRWRTLGPV